MSGNDKKRFHHFDFPGHTGRLSISLEDQSFSDIEDGELYRIGSILSSFLYGLLLEKKEVRESSLNIFHSILKDSSLFIEDRDLNTLLRFSNRAFHNGDYQNSLFISELVLSRINQVIDKKIANDDKTIDKEIIHLQISTLNFIGYLFSKTGKNLDYGLKLASIANTLLDEFDENDGATLALRAAIYDTLGALQIKKKSWDEAIRCLESAQECDQNLLSRGEVDEIGFRLTCSNLGYALVQKCRLLIKDSQERLNVHEIEETLERALRYFMMVPVDRAPAVPEKLLTDLELQSAVKRMKKGLELCEEAKRNLHRRFI
jgi:tetratricopeptide (TPR) repeat protein